MIFTTIGSAEWKVSPKGKKFISLTFNEAALEKIYLPDFAKKICLFEKGEGFTICAPVTEAPPRKNYFAEVKDLWMESAVYPDAFAGMASLPLRQESCN